MKKIVAIATAITIAIILACSCTLAEAETAIPDYSGFYPRLAMVCELDYDADIVTVVDGAGLLWQFYECDDWCIGDYVDMPMFDNGTPESIYDDVILLTYYGGDPLRYID